jgi:hypothetical protein
VELLFEYVAPLGTGALCLGHVGSK